MSARKTAPPAPSVEFDTQAFAIAVDLKSIRVLVRMLYDEVLELPPAEPGEDGPVVALAKAIQPLLDVQIEAAEALNQALFDAKIGRPPATQDGAR